MVHIIGGDWGKEPNYSEHGFLSAACIRGSEFKHWKRDLGSTAVERRIKISNLEKRALRSGDILVEISGGGPEQPVGRTVLISEAVIRKFSIPVVGTNFLRLIRPADNIESSYVNRYLEYFYQSGEVIKYQGGSNNLRNLKFKEYSAIALPIPSFSEQKVIAEKLDTLLAQVDSAKTRLGQIPQILKRFRQSVLAAAVSGKLTEEWRMVNSSEEPASRLLEKIILRRQESLSLEIKNGNSEANRIMKKIKSYKFVKPEAKLPGGWTWTTFLESMEKVVDCHNKTAPYIEKGIHLIRTPDVRNGKILLNNTRYINEDTYRFWSKRCPPQGGDIIFTREAPMGEAGIVPADITLCMGQRMMLLRPLLQYLQPKYVLLNIISLNFQERMNAQAIGTGVKHLRVADVESLLYPLAPFNEQTEIVRRVEQLFAYADTIEKQVQDALLRVNNLTQSILAKAFRGELTEQWRAENPDLISGENSAEALLAKIKAERETVKPKKKSAK